LERAGTVKKRVLLPTVGLVLGLLPVACQTAGPGPEYVRDGRQYGVYDGLWRDRWWNFYGRGLSFADGEFWDEAVRDLERSIELRAAVARKSVDQYMARTYGTHFVDFFPHRELGVVHYSQGNYDAAIRELEVSRSQTDTAKARYFLDLARSASLRQTGADQTPPELELDVAGVPGSTSSFEVRISGRARDDTYVARVTVGRQPVRIPAARPVVEFDVTVPVERGTNTIMVEAVDLVGHPTSRRLSIEGDHEGPALTIVAPNPLEPVTARRTAIRGIVKDRSGVTSLRIGADEVDVASVDGARDTFAFRHDILLQTGLNLVRFECTDGLDNVTRSVMAVRCQLQHGRRTGHPYLVYAGYGQSGAAGAAVPGLTLQVNRQTADGVAEILDPWNVYGPEARVVVGIFAAQQTTVSITGGAGSPIEDTVPAGMTMRTYTVRLDAGENRVRIEAASRGRTQSRDITVIRHAVGIENMAWRLELAVLPPGCSAESAVRPQSSSLIRALCQQTLFDAERFNIVERERLDVVLDEQQLSVVGLTDPRSAIRVGELVAAEALVLSDVRETDSDIQILQRVVDTETSRILTMKDAYCEDKEYDTVKSRISELVHDICSAFPLLEGAVVRREGDDVFVNLGTEHGLRQGYRLNIVDRGDPIVDDRNGQVLLDAPPKVVADVCIEDAYPRLSRARAYHATERAVQIRPGLEVWTK